MPSKLFTTRTQRARVLVTVEGSNFDPYVAEYFVQSNGNGAGFTASLLSADEPPLTSLGYPKLSGTEGAGEGPMPPSACY